MQYTVAISVRDCVDDPIVDNNNEINCLESWPRISPYMLVVHCASVGH